MSMQRNDSIFNSSDEGEAIQLSDSSPAPGVLNGNKYVTEASLEQPQPKYVSEASPDRPQPKYVSEASPDQPQPKYVPEASPDRPQHKYVAEASPDQPQPKYVSEASPDQPEMQLGVDLGRRLARLELGNELNKQLDNVNQKAHTYEEAFVIENVRVGDLEGKVISMETRLLSEEKLGLDVKERIGNLEDKLRKKDEEILELKDMLVNYKTERVKQNERFDKLERESVELTSQFVTLLDTCQSFNDELQSLKKMNFEIKRQLKNGESRISVTTPKFSSPDVEKIINAPISQPHPLFQNPSTIVSRSRVSPNLQSDPTTVPTSCVIPDPPTYPTRVLNNSLFNSAKVLTPTPTLGSQRNTTSTKIDCVPLPSHPTSYLSQELVNQSYNPLSQELNPDLYNFGPAGPVYFSTEATEPAGHVFYHPEADAYMTLHYGSTPQSGGIEVNQDFGAYYCQR